MTINSVSAKKWIIDDDTLELLLDLLEASASLKQDLENMASEIKYEEISPKAVRQELEDMAIEFEDLSTTVRNSLEMIKYGEYGEDD